MSALLREYGVATTIAFPLIKAGTSDFATGSDYTPVSGDVKISKDEGAANTTATATPTALTMGNGAIWTLPLTGTEMSASRIYITVIDAATKAVNDQMIIIETYGAGNGTVEINRWSDGLLKRDWTSVTGEASRSVLNALRKIRNKWSIASTTITYTKEDDSTSAFSSTITVNGSNQITSEDPT